MSFILVKFLFFDLLYLLYLLHLSYLLYLFINLFFPFLYILSKKQNFFFLVYNFPFFFYQIRILINLQLQKLLLKFNFYNIPLFSVK